MRSWTREAGPLAEVVMIVSVLIGSSRSLTFVVLTRPAKANHSPPSTR
jgi:hypothetical protein